MAQVVCAVCECPRASDQFQRAVVNPYHVCNRCCIAHGHLITAPSGRSEMQQWCPKTAHGVEEMRAGCLAAAAALTAHITRQQAQTAYREAQRRPRVAGDQAAAAVLVERHRRRGPHLGRRGDLTDSARGYARFGTPPHWGSGRHWGRCGEVHFWQGEPERMLTGAAAGEAASLCSSFVCACCSAQRVLYHQNGLADSETYEWTVCQLCLQIE